MVVKICRRYGRFFQVPYLRLELFLRKKYKKYYQNSSLPAAAVSGSGSSVSAPPRPGKTHKSKERALDEQKRAHVGLDNRKFGMQLSIVETSHTDIDI